MAALFCAWGLLPAIYTERALGPSFFNVYNHIPFTMAEFAAVLNGLTPLVDFFPQYQIIAPYALYPVFKLTGFSVLSYTCVVSAVGLAGLLCVWLALRKVAGEGHALLLFLIFAATAFYPDQRKGDEIYYLFNYYAMPLRYFGPWLLTLTTVWVAEKPEVRGRLYWHAAAAAFVAFNNFDFGIAPCAASCCALMVVRRDRARVVVSYALAVAAVAAALCLLCVARAGALPEFARLADFHRLFGLCGLMAAPMPVLGAHIIMLGVFAGALISGISAARSNVKLAALLVYGGVFGLGAFAYYAGRSLPGTLLFVFPVWVFCNIVLWLRVKESAANGAGPVKWFLAAQLALFACSAGHMANPVGQFKRIAGGDDRVAQPYRQMLSIVRATVRPGEKAGIMCLNGHRLALDAGAANVFPFASQDAVVLWKQAELAASIMAGRGAGRLLGPVPPEMEPMLRRAGYVKTPGQDMWSRATDTPLGVNNNVP